MGEDAGRPKTLDLDLIGPIRVLCRTELVFERLQIRDLRLGARKIPGPGLAECAAERNHRLGPREALERKADRWRRQRNGARPVAALQYEAHRDRRDGISCGPVGSSDLAKTDPLVD